MLYLYVLLASCAFGTQPTPVPHASQVAPKVLPSFMVGDLVQSSSHIWVVTMPELGTFKVLQSLKGDRSPGELIPVKGMLGGASGYSRAVVFLKETSAGTYTPTTPFQPFTSESTGRAIFVEYLPLEMTLRARYFSMTTDGKVSQNDSAIPSESREVTPAMMEEIKTQGYATPTNEGVDPSDLTLDNLIAQVKKEASK